jgi:steroid delta-isomerase-like uncharacterized protein
MMDEDAVKVARGCLDAFNRGDWADVGEFLAADSVYDEFGTRRHIEGAEATVAALQAWKTAMPDAAGTVRNVLASGNTVALEVTWEGTHTGPLETPSGPIAASGRHQRTPGVWSVDVTDGKIRSSRQYFDMLTLLQQIGAAPA